MQTNGIIILAIFGTIILGFFALIVDCIYLAFKSIIKKIWKGR